MVAELGFITFNCYGGDEFRVHRRPHLVHEILHRQPAADVICLQECTHAIADAIIRAASEASPPVSYELVWTKQQAAVDYFRSRILTQSIESDEDAKKLITIDDVAELTRWERPAAVASKIGGSEDADIELSELMVLVRDGEYVCTGELTQKLTVLEKELVHPGNWFDDGTMRIRLKVESAAASRVLDVYNLHFAGGSFGKPAAVVAKKRELRRGEFRTLRESILRRGDAVAHVLLAGDYNCDVDAAHRDMFPEAEDSPELHASTKDFQGRGFVDVGSKEEQDLGATESASRNLFREWLKPKQGREVRYDRILASSAEVVAAELLGTRQIAAVVSTVPADVPLFPSDHFGVFARLRLL